MIDKEEEFCFVFGELDFHMKIKALSLEPVDQIINEQVIFAACFNSKNNNIFIGGDKGNILLLDSNTFTIIGEAAKKHKGYIYDLSLLET